MESSIDIRSTITFRSSLYFERLNGYHKQLDASIRMADGQHECQAITQQIVKTYTEMFLEKNIALWLEGYHHITNHIEQYSLDKLYEIQKSYHPHPLHEVTLCLSSTIIETLLQICLVLVQHITIDPQFISHNHLEHELYTQLTEFKTFLEKKRIDHAFESIKIKCLHAFVILKHGETALSPEQDMLIEKLLNNDDLSTLVKIWLKKTACVRLNAHYELEKTQAMCFFLKAIHEKKKKDIKKSQIFEEKITTFQQTYAPAIQQDPLMDEAFGLYRLSKYFDEIHHESLQNNTKKKKKKKKKKCADSTIAQETAILDTSTREESRDEETEKVEDVTKLNQGIFYIVPQPADDRFFIQWSTQYHAIIKKNEGIDSESFILLKNSIGNLLPLLKNNMQVLVDAYVQCIIQARKIVSEHVTLGTLIKTPYLYEFFQLLTRIGVDCISMIRMRIEEKFKEIQTSSVLEPSLFFQPQLFSEQASSPFEFMREFNENLLEQVLGCVEIFAYSHLFYAEIVLKQTDTDEAVRQAQSRSLIYSALAFHEKIYDELKYQYCTKKTRYILEKMSYAAYCLEIKTENNKIPEEPPAFLRTYANAIRLDPQFNRLVNNDLPWPLVNISSELIDHSSSKNALLDESHEQQLLKTTLENTLAETLIFIQEHVNDPKFENQYRHRLKQIEDILNDSFKIKQLLFTVNQYERILGAIGTLTLYSLSSNMGKEVPIINEKSVMVISELSELIIKSSCHFVSNINAHIQIEAIHAINGILKLEQFKLHQTYCQYAEIFAQISIRAFFYVNRIHLLLCQFLMDSKHSINHTSIQVSNKYLKRSQILREELVKELKSSNLDDKLICYYSYYLEEIGYVIRAKIEEYQENERKANGLKKAAIKVAAIRQTEYAEEHQKDCFLTPSYGYEEILNFWSWIEKKQNTLQVEQPTPKMKKPSPKKKKKSKISTAADLQSTELQSTELQSTGLQSTEMQSTELQSTGLQSTEMQSTEMQSTEMQSQKISTENISRDINLVDSKHSPIFISDKYGLGSIFEQLKLIIQQSPCANDTYMYGSSLFKTSPNDFDLCILNIATANDMMRVNQLIDHFIRLGAFGGKKNLEKNLEKNEYGYHDNGRHTITMFWSSIPIDITLSSKKFFYEFIHEVDYSICAMGYDFKQNKVVHHRDTNGWHDLEQKIIDTTRDPIDIFTEDPCRILRGIRLMAAENLSFSNRCLKALHELFKEDNNIFSSEKVEFHVLMRHVKRLFSINKPLPLSKFAAESASMPQHEAENRREEEVHENLSTAKKSNKTKTKITEEREETHLCLLQKLGLLTKLKEALINKAPHHSQEICPEHGAIVQRINQYVARLKSPENTVNQNRISPYRPSLFTPIATSPDTLDNAQTFSFYGEKALSI